MVHRYRHDRGGDGATLAILAFCENIFCRNLKTNKVKFMKVYIFTKEILQGIYLYGQIFDLILHFLEIAKNF